MTAPGSRPSQPQLRHARSAQFSTRLSTRLRVRVPCQCSSPRFSKFISPLFFLATIFCRLHFIAQTLSRPSQLVRSREKKYLPNARRRPITHPKLRPGACPGSRRRCCHCHCHCRNPSLFLVLQSFGSIPHLAPPAACTQLPSSRAALAALENQSELVVFHVFLKKTSRFARMVMSRKPNACWTTNIQMQHTSELHSFAPSLCASRVIGH